VRGPKQKIVKDAPAPALAPGEEPVVRVRRIHRRDLNRTWEFLKLVFREVNRETVEYQRPRVKKRFLEVYEEEGVEQLLFEVDDSGKAEIVGYAECAFEILGADNWMNERYFAKKDMRPLFVEELAVHPDYQGRGIGAFVLEQLEHLARVRGCTHLVLEVAENNNRALNFYRTRSFYRLDAAIFLAKKVESESELLPPRPLKKPKPPSAVATPGSRRRGGGRGGAKAPAAASAAAAPRKTVIVPVPPAPAPPGAAPAPAVDAPAAPAPALAEHTGPPEIGLPRADRRPRRKPA
jgi:ribosomal protein S18 acetylase RimI-like enzyme